MNGDYEQALAVLDTYQRQIDALSRQLSFLQTVHDETVRARETLESLKQTPKEDLLIPLGSNTFIHAKATQSDVAISGIGAGYAVENTWEEAIARLGKRREEVEGEMRRLSEGIVRLQQEASALQEELQRDLEHAKAPVQNPSAKPRTSGPGPKS